MTRYLAAECRPGQGCDEIDSINPNVLFEPYVRRTASAGLRLMRAAHLSTPAPRCWRTQSDDTVTRDPMARDSKEFIRDSRDVQLPYGVVPFSVVHV